MKKFLLSLCLLFVTLPVLAFQPLPVDEAFTLSAKLTKQNVVLYWKLAPGYYLYRDRISLKPSQNINLPTGIAKEDDILGKYQVYEDKLILAVPIAEKLIVNYQGCAASGFCYPSVSKLVSIDGTVVNITHADNAAVSSVSIRDPETTQDKATQLLVEHNWFLILSGFLSFGLLLAFTPCVLPLLPILSGIIVGQGKNLTTQKAFALSFIYVLAMAIAYACAGVIAGVAGSYVQAFLQNPWVLGTFSLVFILLAFSLFGFYELHLPASWQEKLTNLSNQQKGGTYFGVAAMGALSTLIVSPCVTAPLIGALTYIGKTGDAALGGIALFVMGLGFGVPLLIVGTAGGKLLPKAGRWMNIVKAIFGVLMLLMATWLLARIPAVDNFMESKFATVTAAQTLSFKRIKSVQDLERELTIAKSHHKPVMLDFYADWCAACKQMARTTFRDPKVYAALSNVVLLQADVTANDKVDQLLEKHFNVIAPPTMIFFDSTGKELVDKHVVGEMSASKFLSFLCTKLIELITCFAP